MNLCVLTVAAHLVQQHSEEGVQLANHIIWKCQILWFGAMLAFQSSKPQDSDRLNAHLLIMTGFRFGCKQVAFAVATAFVAGTGDCKDDF